MFQANSWSLFRSVFCGTFLFWSLRDYFHIRYSTNRYDFKGLTLNVPTLVPLSDAFSGSHLKGG